MDAVSIRNNFANHLGTARYAKFLRCLNLSARNKGRLLFWQEAEWNSFCKNNSVAQAVDLFAIFAICDVHNLPLIGPTPNVLIKNDSPDFREIRSQRFPYVARKPKNLSCAGCNDAYQNWMTKKHSTTETIYLLEVMNVHSRTLVACRMWPLDRQKLDSSSGLIFDTPSGKRRFEIEDYRLTHSTWSSNEEPRHLTIHIKLDAVQFNAPIGSEITIEHCRLRDNNADEPQSGLRSYWHINE